MYQHTLSPVLQGWTDGLVDIPEAATTTRIYERTHSSPCPHPTSDLSLSFLVLANGTTTLQIRKPEARKHSLLFHFHL